MKLIQRVVGTLLAVGLAGLSSVVMAADSNGEFSVRGAGLLSCETYSAERAKQSDAYLMIGGWIDGYVTAVNASSPATYDITSYQSTELLSEILANHCAGNPSHRLFAVLAGVMRKLHDNRLTKASPRQRIVVGDKEAVVYQAMVIRMQTSLAERRLMLLEEVNGTFDATTAAALRKYQTSENYLATGFPDQATLWKLFESGEEG